jgi:hypothetical protein
MAGIQSAIFLSPTNIDCNILFLFKDINYNPR